MIINPLREESRHRSCDGSNPHRSVQTEEPGRREVGVHHQRGLRQHRETIGLILPDTRHPQVGGRTRVKPVASGVEVDFHAVVVHFYEVMEVLHGRPVPAIDTRRILHVTGEQVGVRIHILQLVATSITEVRVTAKHLEVPRLSPTISRIHPGVREPIQDPAWLIRRNIVRRQIETTVEVNPIEALIVIGPAGIHVVQTVRWRGNTPANR